MKIEKIESIKLALMQVVEFENMEKDKSDFIVRSSIFLSLKDLGIVNKEDDLQYVVTDMYKTLLEKTLEAKHNLDPVNYVGGLDKIRRRNVRKLDKNNDSEGHRDLLGFKG